MYDGEGSELGPRGTFESYRAEGDALYKNAEYRKAIESLTTALEMKANDKDCLVARSRCYLMLGDSEKALGDAESSLQEDKHFHKGLFQKAEALYSRGEFELALVFYHRGHKMRPELQEFRLGIQKAQEAIDNSVGSPEKIKLTKEGDLSFFQEQAKSGKKAKCGYQRSPAKSRKARQSEPPASLARDKTVRQLLGELYGDRVYLERLMNETDKSTDTGKNIYNLVCDGLRYLDTRTEFWRQQKPMYARRKERRGPLAKPKGDQGSSAHQYVIKELHKLEEEQANGQFAESLKRARKCLKTVEGYPDGGIQDREDVMASLHSYIGNAFLELGDFEKALQHHQRDKELGDNNELPESVSRALDNIGRVHARKGDYRQAIDSWNEKLPSSKSALERTWLFHEIGRCQLELREFALARDYAEKSSAAADEAGDEMWQLNASVLVAQAQVKLGDYRAAVGSFEKALDMAKLQGDAAAVEAIQRALDDVNSRIVKDLKESTKESSRNSPVGIPDGRQGDQPETASDRPDRAESRHQPDGEAEAEPEVKAGGASGLGDPDNSERDPDEEGGSPEGDARLRDHRDSDPGDERQAGAGAESDRSQSPVDRTRDASAGDNGEDEADDAVTSHTSQGESAKA